MKQLIFVVFIFTSITLVGQAKYDNIHIFSEQILIKSSDTIKSVDLKIYILNNDSVSIYYPKSSVQKVTTNSVALDLSNILYKYKEFELVLEVGGIGYNSNYEQLLEIKPRDTLVIWYKNIKPSKKLKEVKIENYLTTNRNSIVTTKEGFQYYNIHNNKNITLIYRALFKNEDIKDKIYFR